MFTIEFSLDLSELHAELKAMAERMRDFAAREGPTLAVAALAVGHAAAGDAVPRKTGDLRKNIRFRKRTSRDFADRSFVVGGSGSLEWLEPYAASVDTGAKAHPIRAKRKRTLHWVDPVWGPVWYRGVNHPGIRNPKRFGAKVLAASVPIFIDRVGHGLVKALVPT